MLGEIEGFMLVGSLDTGRSVYRPVLPVKGLRVGVWSAANNLTFIMRATWPKSRTADGKNRFHEINIVTLTWKTKAYLDPYDAEKSQILNRVIDTWHSLRPRDGERFQSLEKAIRAVTNSEVRGLMKAEELQAEKAGHFLYSRIESFTDYDLRYHYIQ